MDLLKREIETKTSLVLVDLRSEIIRSEIIEPTHTWLTDVWYVIVKYLEKVFAEHVVLNKERMEISSIYKAKGYFGLKSGKMWFAINKMQIDTHLQYSIFNF